MTLITLAADCPRLLAWAVTQHKTNTPAEVETYLARLNRPDVRAEMAQAQEEIDERVDYDDRDHCDRREDRS